MRSHTNTFANASKSYLSAENDMSTPESMNPYLASIFMPETFGPVPIPDGDPTPIMLKTFMTEFVANWVSGNATVMAVWTPASPASILKFFVYNPGQPWAYINELPLSQPLNQNYQKARLISASFVARSAAQAAGVFTLSGETTSVYVNSMPPFKQLNYNSLLSWIPNGGNVVKGVPVQDGVIALWNPNGYNEFWNPEAPWSFRFQELWDVDASSVQDGWVPSNVPIPFPVGTTVLWNSQASANTAGFPFGPLPDPFWGDWSFKVAFSASSTVNVQVQLEFDVYKADPLTWNSVLDTVVLNIGVIGPDSLNAPIMIPFCYDSPIITTRENIVAVRVVLGAAVAGTFNFFIGYGPIISITSYDYYKPNVMSPAVITMITRVNQDQPVSLSGCYNYELVPNPILARNVPVSTIRGDDICRESALAVLGQVGKGVNMIWNKRDYDLTMSKMFFHRLSSGQTAYEAAGPSLKTRLMSLWKAVNPLLSEFGVAAARGALGLASAKYPFLAPVAGYLGDQYLSAPAGETEEQVWLAAPGFESESGDTKSQNLDKQRIVSQMFALNFPHGLASEVKQIQSRYKFHCLCREIAALADPELADALDMFVSISEKTKSPDEVRSAILLKTASEPGERIPDSGAYLAADVEQEYTPESSLVLVKPRVSSLVPISDFVNIVNGKAAPLETPRAAYFVIVPDKDNLGGNPTVVRLVISSSPLPERNYMDSGISVRGGVSIHYTKFFHTKNKVAFIESLTSYGISCGIISKDSNIYFSVDSELSIKGPSWELACLIALLGIAGDAIYSGSIDWTDPFCPTVGQVGQVALKTRVAASLGVKLVTATSISSADASEIMSEMNLKIMYPGYLCSGLPIPPSATVLAIHSPFDVVLFNMRIMKHRVNMSSLEQISLGGVKNIPKANKAPVEGLASARADAKARLTDAHENIMAQVAESGLKQHQIGVSLAKKLPAWIAIVDQSGTVGAIELQTTNILKSVPSILDRVRAAAQNSQSSGGGRSGKKSKANSTKQKLLDRLDTRGIEAPIVAKRSTIERAAEDFVNDLDFG